MTNAELDALAKGLSEKQKAMLLESGPDDITGEEGLGVEIHGSQYRIARALEAAGLGSHTHGDPYFDMYWNNALGLALRNHLRAQEGSAGGEG